MADCTRPARVGGHVWLERPWGSWWAPGPDKEVFILPLCQVWRTIPVLISSTLIWKNIHASMLTHLGFYKNLYILDFQKCNKDKGMTYPNSKLSKKSALFVSRQRKHRRNKLVNSYFLSVVAASVIFLSCFEIIFQSWTK